MRSVQRVSVVASFLLVLIFACTSFVFGEMTMDVYRMLQFDKVVGGNLKSLGCRKTQLNAPAARFSNTTSSQTNSTGLFSGLGSRQVLVVRLSEFLEHSSSQTLKRFKEIIDRGEVLGVLVLLPVREVKVGDREKQVLRKFEKLLFGETFDKPIYFATETSELLRIHQSMQSDASGADLAILPETYSLSVSEKEASMLNPINIQNFQGLLKGGSVFEEEPNLPIVALVANYDSLGIVPELSRNMESSSGVVAILEIARLFHLLYSSPLSRGAYNLLFIVTGAGQLNYEGSKNWLKKADNQILDNVEFVLALDAIAGENLYLHISQKTREESTIRFYKELNATATQMQIPFEFVFKNLDTSVDTRWEHEVFAARKLSAATLSSVLVPKSKSSSSFLPAELNTQLLERNIRFIAEALARHVYNVSKQVDIFQASTSVNPQFISSWVQVFANHPRATPFMSKENPVTDSLRITLSQFTTETSTQEFEYKGSFKFYGNSKLSLTFYKMKPFFFELLLMVPIGLYLLVLHIYIVGWWEFVSSLSSLFKGHTRTRSSGRRK